VAKATNEIPVNVVREEPAPCRLKLDVEISAGTVQNIHAKVERDYCRHARIPGFRPGKAPKALLKRHYGGRILEDLKDQILRDGTRAALADQNLSPLTVPQIENEQQLTVAENQAFVFAIEFDVAPEFELPDYRHLDLPPEDVEVDDEQVDSFIARLMSRRTSYEKVERAAQAGDLLKATYQAALPEDFEVPATAKYLVEGTETWVALREPEILPGVTAALAGAEAGGGRDIEIVFPEDFYESMFAGRTLPYHVEVVEVHASVVPELTDEVAKSMGAESADDVRERVRANLESEERRQKFTARREAIVDQLLGKVDFPLPPTLLARESYEALVGLYQQAARDGAAEDQLKEQMESMRHEADRVAQRTLKRKFLLERIAEAEELQLDPREIDATIRMMAQYQKMSEKKCLQQLRESGRLMDLIDDLRSNRTLQHLLQIHAREDAAGGDA
jgi:trigger factor